MENQAYVTPTPFINVFVTAVPKTDADGNKTYETTFVPARVLVVQHDTVLNYQLIAPTPQGVTIKSVSVKPEHSTQLSDPSIGESGKIVTLSNANTIKETFNITLQFEDEKGISFLVDPEVENEPPVNPRAARALDHNEAQTVAGGPVVENTPRLR
jgi:hypothetical protein